MSNSAKEFKKEFERKGKDPELPFSFNGLAMVSANQPLHTSDQTSGIQRRKISVHFSAELVGAQS